MSGMHSLLPQPPATLLPADEPKYAKFKDVLTKLKADIRRTA